MNHPLVAPLPQADRQGRASDFGAAYAKSKYKQAADKEIAAQLAMASDLGGCAGRLCCCRGLHLCTLVQLRCLSEQPAPFLLALVFPPWSPHPADEETRKDLAVKRDTSVPFWWALRTLLKVIEPVAP